MVVLSLFFMLVGGTSDFDEVDNVSDDDEELDDGSSGFSFSVPKKGINFLSISCEGKHTWLAS
jgi:hypothetical protein